MIITSKTTMHKWTKNIINSQLLDGVHCSRINNIFGLGRWNTISLVLTRLRTILLVTAHFNLCKFISNIYFGVFRHE